MNKRSCILLFTFCIFQLPNFAHVGDVWMDSIFSAERAKRLMDEPSFEENKGQFAAADGTDIRFRYQADDVSIFLLPTGIAYQFSKIKHPAFSDNVSSSTAQLHSQRRRTIRETYRMDISMQGANPFANVIAEEESECTVHYYNYDVLSVKKYAKITYQGIYPNIDWVIYQHEGGVKYDFIVHPGGNPKDIKMQVIWAENAHVQADGSLILRNRLGQVIDGKPVSYQEGKPVETQFSFVDNVIEFNLEEFSPGKPLVIDPTLSWSSYFGEGGSDEGRYCATDLSGNVYLTGWVASDNNVLAAGGHQITYGGGAWDTFIAKYDTDGVRQWTSYYGGTSTDWGLACTVDMLGNVYLVGDTQSSDNITSSGHQNSYGGGVWDAFLVKFNADGIRQWATYYGGFDNDHSHSCSVDASGNVYLVGTTLSSNNISTSQGHQTTHGGGVFDAFLVKFNASGVRQWATYYGGDGDDRGRSCPLDAAGNIYICGRTESSSNIASSGSHQSTYGGVRDGYLAKFNPDGVRQWATYYGGSESDEVASSALDRDGNIYLAGRARSADNIAWNGTQMNLGGVEDAFLVKFLPSGQRDWCTYLGGSGEETGWSCAIDANDDVYLAGWTSSSDNIALNAYQEQFGGGAEDAFLAKFSGDGTKEWATYFGGAGNDRGYRCAVDDQGSPYLCGWTQSGSGIAYDGHQVAFGGNRDAFIAKFACAGFAEQVCTNTLLRSCDDGNPCTFNDMETVDACDNSIICTPCAGIAQDCASGATEVSPCDDGNPNTINDVEIILSCDGSVCMPCIGTATDCSTAPTTVVPCDDNNPCTIDDVQTVLDSDGSVCIPCSGNTLDCTSGATSVLPCDDGNPNTMNDFMTVLLCDGTICKPCEGISVLVTDATDVYIPNAFSPNGDGVNDVFSIFSGTGTMIIKHIQIFDRWGGNVFATSNINADGVAILWDGKHRGQKVNFGIYTYWIELELANGQTAIRTGDVMVVE